MKKILEEISKRDITGEYVVNFNDGEIYRLKNFEKVDKSIYGNDDMFVATVVLQVEGEKKIFRPGSYMEFSYKDISSMEKL